MCQPEFDIEVVFKEFAPSLLELKAIRECDRKIAHIPLERLKKDLTKSSAYKITGLTKLELSSVISKLQNYSIEYKVR